MTAGAVSENRVSDVVLDIRGLRKVYGGTVALGGVDFSVRRGEIHALLGENGAGKSTLVKLLAGIEPCDGGAIMVDGQPLPANHTSREVDAAGVAFIHQQIGLVGDMTVAENIALLSGYPKRAGFIDWRAISRIAAEALARMRVDIDPEEMVANLPVSAQSVVAIARALVRDSKLLILDEPTASLTVGEVATLFGILRRLRDEGVGIVLISHRLDEVRALCDRVTVLRDGEVVGVSAMADVSDAAVVEMIVGRQVARLERKESRGGESFLEFENVTSRRLRGVTARLNRGEVVGIAGLSGSGHTEIGSVLFGQAPIVGGSMLLAGREYRPAGAADAIARGIGFVPGDRNGEGAAVELSLRENLYLNPKERPFRLFRRNAEARRARMTLEKFDVRPPEPEAVFSTLSGGNAQKVVLARWLAERPDIIVLNDPTAAVDIGARLEIHRLLRSAAAEGSLVIVITSDMEEVEQVCDRVLVCRGGHVVADLASAQISVEQLTRYSYEAA